MKRALPLLCALAVLPAVASGDLCIIAESVVMDSPASTTTNYIELFFQVTGTPPAELSGYQVKVVLTPQDGLVTLGDAMVPTAHPPVFATGGFWGSSTDYTSTGTDFLPMGQDEGIDSGEGLLRVPFTVQAGTVGTYDVIIDTSAGTGTALSDVDGNPIAFTAVDGQIRIVPEPSALLLLLSGAVALVSRRRRR